MRSLISSLVAEVVAVAAAVAVVYYIYTRVKKDATDIIPSPEKVLSSAGDIVRGGPSALVSWLKGESADTYIDANAARKLAADRLAAVKAGKAAAIGG